MNAFQFLDIEFQKRAIDISKMRSDNYCVKIGGEAQAQRMLLEFVRVFYKWWAVPKVIGKFWAVKLGVIAEPISPLIPKAAPPPSKPEAKPLSVVPPEGNPAHDQGTPSTTG